MAKAKQPDGWVECDHCIAPDDSAVRECPFCKSPMCPACAAESDESGGKCPIVAAADKHFGLDD